MSIVDLMIAAKREAEQEGSDDDQGPSRGGKQGKRGMTRKKSIFDIFPEDQDSGEPPDKKPAKAKKKPGKSKTAGNKPPPRKAAPPKMNPPTKGVPGGAVGIKLNTSNIFAHYS